MYVKDLQNYLDQIDAFNTMIPGLYARLHKHEPLRKYKIDIFIKVQTYAEYLRRVYNRFSIHVHVVKGLLIYRGESMQRRCLFEYMVSNILRKAGVNDFYIYQDDIVVKNDQYEKATEAL